MPTPPLRYLDEGHVVGLLGLGLGLGLYLDEGHVVGLRVPIHGPEQALVRVRRAPQILHEVRVLPGRDAAVGGHDGRDAERVAHVDELERAPTGDEVVVPSACVSR